VKSKRLNISETFEEHSIHFIYHLLNTPLKNLPLSFFRRLERLFNSQKTSHSEWKNPEQQTT
jgi:hypothetical protein